MGHPIPARARQPRRGSALAGGWAQRGPVTTATHPSGLARRVLELQREAGNRAVTGWLTGRSAAAPSAGPLVVQRAPTSSDLRGLAISALGSGAPVTIIRVVGEPGGYADRWMATAVARLAKTEPAAVVRRTDTGRWCAALISAPWRPDLSRPAWRPVRRPAPWSTGCTACRRWPICRARSTTSPG